MEDKIKVDIWEFERGWGSKIDDTVEFDNLDQAKQFCEEFNSKNNLDVVPDWYMQARIRQ